MGSRLLQNGLPVGTEANDEILSMPFTQEIFTNGIWTDPFVNELARIRHSMKCLEQKHRRKKRLEILPQYQKENKSIMRKYDLLLQIEDETFKKDMTLLAELRRKVESGLSVNKEITAHFGEQTKLHMSYQGQIPEQLGEFIVAQAAPTDQVEVSRFNSTASHLPPGAIVEQLGRTSMFHTAPSRNLESATGGLTGT